MAISKLGLAINVFEGTEFIETILSELYGEVDYILIIYQKTSYMNNAISDKDINNINNYKKDTRVNKVFEYKFKHDIDYRKIETDKRNKGLNILKSNNCSHAIVIDSDELYARDEFVAAKKYIESNNILVSYCTYINYYKSFDYVIDYKVKCYVPFITSIDYKFKYKHTSILGPTDLTRRYKVSDVTEFDKYIIHEIPDNILIMHHCSWIREDISNKVYNWSSKEYFSHETIEKVIDCYNKFDGTSKNVNLLVFSPNNEVVLEKNKYICTIQIK